MSVHGRRYAILEILYSTPPRISARDRSTGLTAAFPWAADALPTQSDLARIFAEKEQVSGSPVESPVERRADNVVVDRRRFPRILHCFEGLRRGVVPLPIRIYELGQGGCLIESRDPEARGCRLRLDIELPWEGTITVNAEVVYARPEYGYAVQFVDVPDDIRRRLDRVIQRLETQRPWDE